MEAEGGRCGSGDSTSCLGVATRDEIEEVGRWLAWGCRMECAEVGRGEGTGTVIPSTEYRFCRVRFKDGVTLRLSMMRVDVLWLSALPTLLRK